MTTKDIKLGLLIDEPRTKEIFDPVMDLFNIIGHGHFVAAEAPFGKAAYDKSGDVLPPATVDLIRKSDAVLMGLIDKNGVTLESPVGKMRKLLSLYADIRPVRSLKGPKQFDLVFIRESSEGFLSDRNCYAGKPEFMPTSDVALSVRVITRNASLKIARFAFEYALKNGRKTILAAHKKNVLPMTCGLFLDCFYEVARDYPAITTGDDYADHVANELIINPGTYDIILTTNLFGDILSDLGSALCENLCAACNLSDNAAVYMPVTHMIQENEKNRTGFFYSYMLCTARILAQSDYIDESRWLERAIQNTFDLSLTQEEAGRRIKEAVLTCMEKMP
jgi:isocitrate/isopropylmalate dehydrogenase